MLPALRAAGEQILRIFSSDLRRGRTFALEHGVPSATDNLAIALDDGVDAVYVSSTNERHAAHVISAARAGRHVLCEKPLATNAEDAAAMIAACRDNRVVLGVDHHLRASEAIRELARQIRAGAVGEVLSARVQNAISLPERLRTWRLREPRAGAGVIFDLAVHDIDVLRYVLGCELIEVIALAESQGLGRSGVEDAVVSSQRYGEGIIVGTHDAYTVPFAPTAVEIYGTAGVLTAVDVLRPDSAGQIWLSDRAGGRRLEFPVGDGVYVRLVRGFCDAVRNGQPPPVTGDDGMRSLLGALALRESVATGARVRTEAMVARRLRQRDGTS
jgi:1,5-anhydro-D-fructose reductase (1,5-anhydro-D-mannitol-forming)